MPWAIKNLGGIHMLRGQHCRRKVISRVLSALPLLASDGWTFIWEHCCQCPRAVSLEIHAREPRVKFALQRFPHDLSLGGVYRAALVSKCAVRSYRTVSPFPPGVPDTLGD